MPATDMGRAVVMVLLDALRHDAAPDWTSGLEGDGVGIITGAVREVFGFMTRPAYFAGLYPETSGQATMVVHSPETSPFRSLRRVPRPLLRLLDRRPLLSRIVRGRIGKVLRRRQDAVALYGSTLDIPLDALPAFDFAEKMLPWDGYAGHDTLFSMLRARGDAYAYVGYPFITTYGTDAQTVRTFREQYRPETCFAFLQLNDLDGRGHAEGPDSAAYADGVQDYRHHLAEVVAHCRDVHGERVDIIAFGDHGMVRVTRVVDILGALAALPRAVQRGLTCFVDSTLLRVWHPDGAALAAVAAHLSTLPGGCLLDDADRAHHRIRFPDDRVGQLLYLADPGTVFHPNYFGRFGAPVRGMHGYDPAHPANMGALAIASTRVAAGDAGTVDQVDLFPTTLDLLGLPVPGSCEGRSLVRNRMDRAS